MRQEKAAATAAAAATKLEAQLAKVAARSNESGAELAALTAERRILKARLMQASESVLSVRYLGVAAPAWAL